MNPCIHSNRFDQFGDELIVHAGFSDMGTAGFFLSSESYRDDVRFRTPKVFYTDVETALEDLAKHHMFAQYKLRTTLAPVEGQGVASIIL